MKATTFHDLKWADETAVRLLEKYGDAWLKSALFEFRANRVKLAAALESSGKDLLFLAEEIRKGKLDARPLPVRKEFERAMRLRQEVMSGVHLIAAANAPARAEGRTGC